MNVSELRRVLGDMPFEMEIAISSPDFFPVLRQVAWIEAVKTRPPHEEGQVVIFGGAPKAVVVTQREDS